MVKRRRNRYEADEYLAPDNSTAPVKHTGWEERHTQYVIGDSSTKASRVRTHLTIFHDAVEQLPEPEPFITDSIPTNKDLGNECEDENIPDNLEHEVCELEALGLGDISSATQSRPRRTRLVCHPSTLI